MNNYKSHFFSFRLWAGILGSIWLIASGSFYFFNVSANVSAQTEAVEKPAAQNLVNGRLAVSRAAVGPGPDRWIQTSNPDGSGATLLPIQGSLLPTEPAWSPDGTRIAFVGTQPPFDIYVINVAGSGQTNLTNTAAPIGERNPSWSVTGKIAYERRLESNSAPQIWTMNADGSGQAHFSAITRPSPITPAWSPDGMKFAFVSGGEIWVINADGTNELQVTMSESADTDPAWSPDGSKIVFRKGGSGIAVINADGTNEMILTSTSGDQLSWSPDGTKIAFRGSDGVYTMDANGSNKVRILTNVINFPQCCDIIYENPAWQPVEQTPNTFSINGRVSNNNLPVSGATVNLSGSVKASTTTDAVGNYQFSGLLEGGSYTVSPSIRRHYFTPPNRSFNNLSSNQTGDFEVLGVCYFGKCVKNGKIAFTRSGDIFTINTDGTNETNITNNAANDGDPKWSPDGSNIIFPTNRDGNYEIYRMNADGSNPVRLTNNAANDASPYYSPDGASIVFASNRDGSSEIYKMNADGSNPVRLTTNSAPDSEPAFSPDGQKITYIEYGSAPGIRPKVYTINADGSNPQQIPVPGGTVPGYQHLDYSPDGSKIIFTYSSDTQSFGVGNTWTMNPDGSNPAQFHNGRYGTYSPDMAKVSFVCCSQDFSNRLRTSNIDGSSAVILTSVPSSSATFVYAPDWQPIPAPHPAPFDFDGDGRSDISVFRPSNSGWYLLRSTEGLWVPQWGLSTDVLAPADYDGDLKTDISVWRPSDGNFYILNSFDNTVRIENFGLDGDIPTGGDWDGDGKADLAVYRPGVQGIFYYRGSMGNPQGNVTFTPWGVSGDKPIAGDFDGDGRTDAAIYRSGIWYILGSSSGQSSAVQFGLADDVLIPADYDADGKTDIAVFRNGIWYLLRSTQGFTAFQFGISNDKPAPADYDGDGRADAAVYRNGVWWILNSQSGTAGAVSFGVETDAPVPSAFVR